MNKPQSKCTHQKCNVGYPTKGIYYIVFPKAFTKDEPRDSFDIVKL